MVLPEDHPATIEDSGERDAAPEDSADPGAAEEEPEDDGGDDPEESEDDGGDDLDELEDDGGDDPADDSESAATADSSPPEPHYERQVHHLDYAEGPFPSLLWRAMQRIGFPLRPRYEAHLYKNA